MSDLRFTLISDGSADRALIPILTWLLRELRVDLPLQSEWADLRRLPQPPNSLPDRISVSLELFPCDLLFIHRDAEREPMEVRVEQISNAVKIVRTRGITIPTVCVVPVRMQEAWLLFDEPSIRRAAGNPNGREALTLPSLRKVESLPDPKEELYGLLRTASGLKGRRLRRFHAHTFAPQVSAFIDDFAPLRNLSAFCALEAELTRVVTEQAWNR